MVHSELPDIVEKRTLARMQGGRGRKYVFGQVCDIHNSEAVLEALSGVVGNLRALDFSPAVANALTNALRLANDIHVSIEMDAQVRALSEEIEGRLRAKR